MNLQNGDVDRTLRLAPHTENLIEGMIPRIVPLRWVPEQEVHLFALERGLPIHHDECPHGEGALRFRHREMVALMESDTPGSRHGMLRFADEIKSIHQKLDQKRMAPPEACPVCGELCSGTICKACEMKASLGNI
jgi:uncharacterized protein (TIGR00269 family)